VTHEEDEKGGREVEGGEEEVEEVEIRKARGKKWKKCGGGRHDP